MSNKDEKVENFKRELSGRSDSSKPAYRRDLIDKSKLNIPTYCEKCGGVMVFKGVGEYKCEDCGCLDYDDYGKARNYIEKHPGATSAQVSAATGVTQKAIRGMLKDERLEIAANSSVFLKCEICGTEIRSGRFCRKCEATYHRNLEEKARAHRNANLAGFGTELQKGQDGAKRFTRDW